jgi:hypothetical protein
VYTVLCYAVRFARASCSHLTAPVCNATHTGVCSTSR